MHIYNLNITWQLNLLKRIKSSCNETKPALKGEREAIITARSRSTRFSDEPRNGLRGFGDLFVPKRSLCASEYFTRTPSRVAVAPRSAARSSLLAVCSFVGLISRIYIFVYEYILLQARSQFLRILQDI